MKHPKPNNVVPLTINVTNNGFIVQELCQPNCTIATSDIHVFNEYEDMVSFLKDLYFGKPEKEHFGSPDLV